MRSTQKSGASPKRVGTGFTSCAQPRHRKWRLSDAAFTHTRLFPHGGREGTADHETLSASGFTLSVLASESVWLRGGHLRFDIWITAGAVSVAGLGSARGARRLWK